MRAGASGGRAACRRRLPVIVGYGMTALLALGCGSASQGGGAPVTGNIASAIGSAAGGVVPQPPEQGSATPGDTGSTGSAEAVAGRPGEPGEPASEGISWEDLERLTLEIAGDDVRLEAGSAVASYGGASESVFTLQNRVTEGDLDGDGDTDVVAHIVEQSTGSGVFHLIVPVINRDGVPAAGRPVAVGDRVVVDGVEVRNGRIQVVLFDRAPDEPFTVITRRSTLDIVVTPSAPLVTVVEVEGLERLPLPGPQRPDIDIRFDPGAVGSVVSGSIGFRERQTYVLPALAGQVFTAEIAAPLGVWLDVRLGDEHVLAPAASRSTQIEATLPVAGPWTVTVLSFNAGEADYELAVEVLPLDGGAGGPDAPGEQDQPAGEPEPGAAAGSEQATAAGPEQTAAAPPVQPPVRPRIENVMYLTFDDGPHPTYTPQVLDVLAEHGAKATFFVIGSLVQRHPDLLDRILAEGHTVANHTWNHESLAGLPRETFDSTVGRTQVLLGSRATSCLRPPYGSVDGSTQDWAHAHGLGLAMWNVDPADWKRPPAETIAEEIVKHARTGAVVLLHDGGGNRSNTVRGLEMALERLSGSGLRFEPMCR